MLVRLVASTGEAVVVGLSPPAEAAERMPRGPFTVAIVLSDEGVADPADPEVALVDGIMIPTPGL